MEHKEPFLLVPFVFSFPKEAKRESRFFKVEFLPY
jgi:hypothetical protein